MSDQRKTKRQLIQELAELRGRIAAWEAARAEQEQAIVQARRTESLYRLIADHVTDVIWTGEFREPIHLQAQQRPQPSATDEDLLKRFQLTYVSPSIDRLLGYRSEEAMALGIHELLAPGSYAQVQAILYQEVLAGQAEARTLELEHRAKDGAARLCEVKVSPLVDPDHRMTGALGVARDITERKRAEAALRANEETLRTISDSALDALVMIDAEGNVVHWNPAAERIFGYCREEILGRSAHGLLVPACYTDQAQQALEEFARSGTGMAVGRILELTALSKDGREIPIEMSISPIRRGDAWWAVAILRDITERRRSEKALERERRLLNQMLDVYERERRLAAYEIHDAVVQPLFAASMSLEGLLPALCPEECRQGADRAMQLLRESIDAARRLMTGLRPPILDELGVVSAIEHLVSERQSGAMEIEFHHDLPSDRFAAPLETAVFRIVQECLSNAVRHSQSDKVRITVLEQEQQMHVEIEDWGVGFDPQHVDPSRFGLEGIRERARLLEGQVTIHAAPGQGTRIMVDLPLIKTPRSGAGDAGFDLGPSP